MTHKEFLDSLKQAYIALRDKYKVKKTDGMYIRFEDELVQYCPISFVYKYKFGKYIDMMHVSDGVKELGIGRDLAGDIVCAADEFCDDLSEEQCKLRDSMLKMLKLEEDPKEYGLHNHNQFDSDYI